MPPFDPEGDERAGYFAAGGLLVVVGWGIAVLLNVLLHLLAPSGGSRFLGVYVGASFGAYAWAAFGLGLFTGAFGLALLLIGRSTPKGRLVLPGFEY